MFDISNMAESVLTSHMKGEKHLKQVRTISGSQNSYFSKSESIDLLASSEGSNNLSAHNNSSINKSLLDSIIASTAVAHAEICWAWKIVLLKYSKSSCDDTVQLLKVMFPNSKVAESLSCAKNKIQIYYHI